MSVRYDPYSDARQSRENPVTRRYIAAWTLIAIGTVIMAYALYPSVMSVLSPPPLVFQHLPWAVRNDPVPRGEAVVLAVSLCNRTNEAIVVTTSRTLVAADGERLHLPSTVEAVRPGCLAHVAATHALPESVGTGRYHLDGVALAQGGYRAVYERWTSQWFMVVP